MRFFRAIVLGSACVAAGVACGSFGSDTTPDPADAAPETTTIPDGDAPDAVGTDATTDAGARCAVGAPFGAATQLGGLGAYSVEAVRFSANRAVVYLSLCPSDGGKPGCDMYQGTVTTTADTYGSLVPMAGANSPASYDSYPTVTGDAKYMFFGSSRNGSLKIYQSTAMGGVFVSPKTLQLPFSASNEPYLLADGRTFYFAATESANPAQWDLYRAEGEAPTFSNPQKVPGVTVDQPQTGEYAPVPTEDELEIFFASSRMPGSDNNFDMWTASRASKTDDFGPAKRIDDLSGNQNEFPTSISPDGCELYYIRKTGSGSGVGTAYVTRRQKP